MQTPVPDPDLTQAATDALWGLAVAIAGSAVVIVVVGVLVARAGRLPFPGSIVTSLTVLATLALVGYAVGGESRPELAAIAGTAVGALAGATTSVVSARQHQEPDTYTEDDDE